MLSSLFPTLFVSYRHSILYRLIHGTKNTSPGVGLLKMDNYSNTNEVCNEIADENIHLNVSHINAIKTYKCIPHLSNLSYVMHGR